MTPAEFNGFEPAFARPAAEIPSGVDLGSSGLSKRELFAAMAMQGMLSAESDDGRWTKDPCAKRAVMFADALLIALEDR